jgi:hypothetical protein
VNIDKFFSVKTTREKFCSAENFIANAMMPDQNVNAGQNSSILLYKSGKGSLTVPRLIGTFRLMESDFLPVLAGDRRYERE